MKNLLSTLKDFVWQPAQLQLLSGFALTIIAIGSTTFFTYLLSNAKHIDYFQGVPLLCVGLGLAGVSIFTFTIFGFRHIDLRNEKLDVAIWDGEDLQAIINNSGPDYKKAKASVDKWAAGVRRSLLVHYSKRHEQRFDAPLVSVPSPSNTIGAIRGELTEKIRRLKEWRGDWV